jgi:hypothetical protein
MSTACLARAATAVVLTSGTAAAFLTPVIQASATRPHCCTHWQRGTPLHSSSSALRAADQGRDDDALAAALTSGGEPRDKEYFLSRQQYALQEFWDAFYRSDAEGDSEAGDEYDWFLGTRRVCAHGDVQCCVRCCRHCQCFCTQSASPHRSALTPRGAADTTCTCWHSRSSASLNVSLLALSQPSPPSATHSAGYSKMREALIEHAGHARAGAAASTAATAAPTTDSGADSGAGLTVVLGCGNSELSARMAADGWTRQLNIDFSGEWGWRRMGGALSASHMCTVSELHSSSGGARDVMRNVKVLLGCALCLGSLSCLLQRPWWRRCARSTQHWHPACSGRSPMRGSWGQRW